MQGSLLAASLAGIAVVAIDALAFGDRSKLGDTFWRSVDALACMKAGSHSPLILSWLPGGFQVGFVHRFKP